MGLMIHLIHLIHLLHLCFLIQLRRLNPGRFSKARRDLYEAALFPTIARKGSSCVGFWTVRPLDEDIV